MKTLRQRTHVQLRVVSVLQFFDEHVTELEEGGRAVPLTLRVFAAVVLEADGAGGGKAGNFSAGDDGLAVEDYGDEAFAVGDFIAVPFADGLVGFHARGDG